MIDLHAHYVSPSLFDMDLSTVGVGYDSVTGSFEFPSGPSRPVPGPLADLDARAQWTRAESIDLQLLSPWMDIVGDDLSQNEGAAWCQMLNDTTASDIAGNSFFRALAALPLLNGDAAAAELARSMAQPEFVGGSIPSEVAGIDLDKAGLDSLFEAAVSLNAPLFLHPFRGIDPARLRQYFLSNVCGIPFDTTVAAMRLFFAGTMDRWPDLKIVLAHCGGTLPFLAGRAAHASRAVPLIERSVDTADEILQRFYFDTMLHDPATLGFAIARVGVDRVMAGTDAPFSMLIDSVADHLRDALEMGGLPEGAFEAVTRTNPEKLLNLNGR